MSAKIEIIDQIGESIVLAQPAQRIVSIVPSITDLLFYLDLGPRVVGRTRFCIHPKPDITAVPRIGGTKAVRIDAVANCNPDLIIANKEENTRADVEALRELCPVYVSDISTVTDTCSMIHDIGQLTDTLPAAQDLISDIASHLPTATQKPPRPALYLIWREPYMSIGGDTYISHMMDHLGYRNLLADQQRYPSLSLEDIAQSGAEVVLLSSEPYPFGPKHIPELQTLLPDAEIKLVDGELFSWYGRRTLEALAGTPTT